MTLIRGNFPCSKYTLIFSISVGACLGPNLRRRLREEGAKLSSAKWTRRGGEGWVAAVVLDIAKNLVEEMGVEEVKR